MVYGCPQKHIHFYQPKNPKKILNQSLRLTNHHSKSVKYFILLNDQVYEKTMKPTFQYTKSETSKNKGSNLHIQEIVSIVNYKSFLS